MAGILDSKSRVLDTIITTRGKRNIGARGKFEIIKGVSSLNPALPPNEEEAMDIARITLPAYLYDVKF